MLHVLPKRLGTNENVVQIHKAALPLQADKHNLHKPLKRHWSIAQSEWHPYELVQSAVRNEGRLLSHGWIDLDLPEPTCKVQSGEVAGLAQGIKNIIDAR